MQTKLTLRLEQDLIERAKAYARHSGKSVSQLVADYFALLEEEAQPQLPELTPLVSSLKGALRNAEVSKEVYHRYLEDKYR